MRHNGPMYIPNQMSAPAPGAAFASNLRPDEMQRQKVAKGLDSITAYNKKMAPKPRTQSPYAKPFGTGMNGEQPMLSQPFGTGMNGEPPAVSAPPSTVMPEVPLATDTGFMGPQQPKAPLLPPADMGANPTAQNGDQPGAFTAFVESQMRGTSTKMGGRRKDRLRGGPYAGKRPSEATAQLLDKWLTAPEPVRTQYAKRAAVMP